MQLTQEVNKSLVIFDDFNYKFLHPTVIDRSNVWSWIEDAYNDNLPDSSMPASLESILIFMEHLFWETLFIRAWVFDDIEYGGVSLKQEINEYLKENPTLTIVDYIEEFYEAGALSTDLPGTHELMLEFCKEIQNLLERHDVCFVVTQEVMDDWHTYHLLPAIPEHYKGLKMLHKPIKKVW